MILAINTASSYTQITLIGSDFKEINSATWLSQNDEAQKLLPAIQDLLDSQKKSFGDIDEILVVRGPGSFTGLRIGLTVANMISYLQKIPLGYLSTFEYHWLNNPELEGKAALVIFAGRHGVYISEGIKKESVLFSLEEAKVYLDERKITNIFGDISADQKSFFQDFTHLDQTSNFIGVLENAKKLGYQLSQAQDHTVPPLYVKSPGITQPKSKLF